MYEPGTCSNQASAASTRGQTYSVDEMRDLMSYVYFSGGFEENGKAAKGRSLFLKKGCQSCHGDGVAGDGLDGDDGRFSAAYMVSAVWSHGPEMFNEMQKSGSEWPTMSGRDVADLIAFLNDEK